MGRVRFEVFRVPMIHQPRTRNPFGPIFSLNQAPVSPSTTLKAWTVFLNRKGRLNRSASGTKPLRGPVEMTAPSSVPSCSAS